MNREPLLRMRHRCELPLVCRTLGYKKIVEVGVNRGVHLRWLATAEPHLLVGIDPWRGMFQQPSEDHYQELLDWAHRTMHAGHVIRLLKMMSAEAAVQFDSGFFDVVYIDGDHHFEEVRNDLHAWWPLVARGGILMGHNGRCDVNPRKERAGVIKAVAEFGAAHSEVIVIENLLCSSYIVYGGN